MNKPVIVFNLIMAVFYPMFFQLLIREKKKTSADAGKRVRKGQAVWLAVMLLALILPMSMPAAGASLSDLLGQLLGGAASGSSSGSSSARACRRVP